MLIDDLVISGMIDQKAEIPLKDLAIVPYDMRCAGGSSGYP